MKILLIIFLIIVIALNFDVSLISASILEFKLTASDGEFGDLFGTSVAISRDTVVVGAYCDDDNGSQSGSAYVFVRSSTSWTQQAKLTASDGAAGDHFGKEVAISGDTTVVGAHYGNNNDIETGSAYVFVRSGRSWTQQAKLTADESVYGDRFGESVAINGDTVVVGAYWDDDNGSASGSAYVFVRHGSSWIQQTKLIASDGATEDFFGVSVAISDDTAVVGAHLDDDNGSEAGSAYVFVRSGTSWTQQAKLTASDAAAGDLFGQSVAISGDTVIVGAFEDDDNGSDSGSAYVFVRSGSSWTQQAKLTASDGAAGDYFGGSIAVSEDTALVGASWDDDNGSETGSAYVFVRNDTSWTQQAKLTASDAAAGNGFGGSVAISGDTILVGIHGVKSGSAYVYSNNEAPVDIAEEDGEDKFTMPPEQFSPPPLPDQPQSPSSLNWGLIGGIIGVIVVLVFIVVLLVRRKTLF